MTSRFRLGLRWAGGLALAASVAMLIAGQTVLDGRLGPIEFALYWALCFLLTGCAIVIAFVDVRATASSTLTEQRELFEATLRKLETEAAEARTRQKPDRNNGDPKQPP